MRKLVLTYFILIASFSIAQWEDCKMSDYLNLANKNQKLRLKETSYSFECLYQFYESFDSPKASLEYKSLFIKEGEGFYFEQFDRLIIQNNVFKLTYDSVQKMIIISDKDSLFQDESLFDIKNYGEAKTKIKRLIDKNFTKFYFELPQGNKYQAIEIYLDNNGSLLKTILYSSSEIENGETIPKMIRPKLEITYSNYKYSDFKKQRMKMNDFITFEDNKLVLNQKYKEFELIDLRKKI